MAPIINFKTSDLLSNLKTRHVFEAVAKPRTISFRDLKRDFAADEESLQESITLLKQADLIGESTAIINDFSTFYVTANGLNAAQVLQQPGAEVKISTTI